MQLSPEAKRDTPTNGALALVILKGMQTNGIVGFLSRLFGGGFAAQTI